MQNQQPDAQENENALGVIQRDLDRILGKLNDSDNLLNQLEAKIRKHQNLEQTLQNRINQIQQQLSQANQNVSRAQNQKQQIEQELNNIQNERNNLSQQLEKTQQELSQRSQRGSINNQVSQQRVQKLEQEKEQLEKALASGDEASGVLKQQLDKAQKDIQQLETRIKNLNTQRLDVDKKKEKNTEAIRKIKDQITKVEQRVSAQIVRMGDLGQVEVSNKSSAQVGAGSNAQEKLKVKALEYLDLFPSIDKATKPKLSSLAKVLGMDPKQYNTKKDLVVAIKLALHCKAGIVRHTKELKIVGKNMQIVEIRRMKTKKEICKKLDSKLGKVSLRKIQNILKR